MSFWVGSYRAWNEKVSVGPRPLFGLWLRRARSGWVRIELIIPGRTFYLNWGSNRRTPGERVDDAMAWVDRRGTWGRFKVPPPVDSHCR